MVVRRVLGERLGRRERDEGARRDRIDGPQQGGAAAWSSLSAAAIALTPKLAGAHRERQAVENGMRHERFASARVGPWRRRVSSFRFPISKMVPGKSRSRSPKRGCGTCSSPRAHRHEGRKRDARAHEAGARSDGSGRGDLRRHPALRGHARSGRLRPQIRDFPDAKAGQTCRPDPAAARGSPRASPRGSRGPPSEKGARRR